jgi:hypothetical protein
MCHLVSSWQEGVGAAKSGSGSPQLKSASRPAPSPQHHTEQHDDAQTSSPISWSYDGDFDEE